MISRINVKEGFKFSYGIHWGRITDRDDTDKILESYISVISRPFGKTESVYKMVSDSSEPSRRVVGFLFAWGMRPRLRIINDWWTVND